MGKISVDTFLAPVSADKPSGEDLSYDAAFLELERIAPGTPEQQVGSTFVAAEEPNWRDVSEMAVELMGRAKHLRVILFLCVAQLKLEGLPGLRDGVAVLRGVLDTFWDSVYPQLDPSDNNDPLERMNIIAQLASPIGTLGDPLRLCERIQTCPVTNSRQFGRLTLRDLMIAKGELPPPEGVKPPEQALIDGAFKDTPPEEIEATVAAGMQIIEHIGAIDRILDERVGVGRAPDLKTFQSAVKDLLKYVQPHAAARSGGVGAGASGAMDGGGGAGSDGAPGRAGGITPLSGEIASAGDVLVAMDKIFRYYERYEVSSPVPVVLRAAQRLVAKNFTEIAKLMTPDAIRTIEDITRQESN